MSAFTIALCIGLNASISQLKLTNAVDRTFSNVKALATAENCVFIDPCFPDPLHPGTFYWRNSDALKISNPSGSGSRANLFNTEFALMPEGIQVRACTPNIKKLRSNPVELECAEKTNITQTGKCPPAFETDTFVSAECFKHLEYDAIEFTDHTLLGNGKMHYAAIAGSAQLIMWDFLPGYACLDKSARSAGQRLSRERPPNKLVNCPEISNSTPYLTDDALACTFTCNTGFDKRSTPDRCHWLCDDAQETECGVGFKAVKRCEEDGLISYKCEQCPLLPGKEPGAWSAGDHTTCQYTACSAGYFSDTGAACTQCPAHTFSAAQASSCTDCLETEWSDPGSAACSTCFAGNAPAGATCEAGFFMSRDFDVIKNYYTTHGAEEHRDMRKLCKQGYACLPCAPGTFKGAQGTEPCSQCNAGTFQNNFAASSCEPCDTTQTTQKKGSNNPVACECKKGYEKV